MPDLLEWPVAGAHFLFSALAGALTPLLGVTAAAAAVVLFTMAIRLVLLPLSWLAIRGERARAVVAPQSQEIYRKHLTDPERLQQELSKLHKANGVSMYAGFLPLLAQMPFFMVTYRLFTAPTVAGQSNDLLAHTLLGTPLRAVWITDLFGHGLANTPVFLCLFAVLAVIVWLTIRRQRRLVPPPDSQTVTQRLLRLLPYGTVVFAMFLPLAAGLYVVTTMAWSLAERTMWLHPVATAGRGDATVQTSLPSGNGPKPT
ncbi:YidC/Oxa1 family membrane protein insertase [Fodinicola acaciae]|uniref:YidC/Oxa1 family membrane protein insertase n=1 Tax=Fodinicola acaciae TaxID=2681555 RepID=UPI0013D190ED|nr:membrane protein insertase YidC [Fodinicola acaciae]